MNDTMSRTSWLTRRRIIVVVLTLLVLMFLLQVDYLKLIESLPRQSLSLDSDCDTRQYLLSTTDSFRSSGCNRNGKGGLPKSSTTPALFNYTLPLRTRGRDIIDARGERVKLASINWYGASDVEYIPAGLEVQHRDDIARLIRDLGFNSVRLPYADEMVRDDPWVPAQRLLANRDLLRERPGEGEGASARDVFTAVVHSLTDVGIMVIVNNHITQATWCCGANPCDAAWNNDWFGGSLFCRVSQTEKEWIANWETVMQPLVANPGVIGVDLRNEPRGLWGTLSWNDWAGAAETAAERLLALNPDWLIVVEGISSANDLSGVRTRPIQLPPAHVDRVVYSAHVYSWSGWGSLKPYSRRTYEDFVASMQANWAFIVGQNIAPVWIGEFGTADQPSIGDRNYWDHLVAFLGELDVSWGYWALNPRKPVDQAWEGYGLVGDGWDESSVRWDYRLDDLSHLGLRPQLRD